MIVASYSKLGSIVPRASKKESARTPAFFSPKVRPFSPKVSEGGTDKKKELRDRERASSQEKKRV